MPLAVEVGASRTSSPHTNVREQIGRGSVPFAKPYYEEKSAQSANAQGRGDRQYVAGPSAGFRDGICDTVST